MSAPCLTDVAAALRVLADWADAQAQAENRASAPRSWVEQKASPLGRRRHINAVRRLVAAGSESARVVGRRYLLSAETVDAELGRVTRSKSTNESPAPAVDELASLRARYASAPKRGRAA